MKTPLCHLVITLLTLLPGTARTEEGPKAGAAGESVSSLVREAFDNNRELLAAIERARASDARPPQEAALPDPMLGFMSTNMSNPIPFTEIGRDPQANAGINVSQEFPFPGKRGLREKIALKEAQGEWLDVAVTRLRIRSELKSALYELTYLKKAGDVYSKSVGALEHIAQVAQSQYEVGAVAQQDVLRAQIEANILRARLFDVAQKQQTMTAELNSLLNRDPGTPAPAFDGSPLSTVLPPLETLRQALSESSPLLRAKQRGVERNLLDVASKERDYYPDVTVGGYYGYAGDLPDMWQLRMDLKIPLYFSDKQRNAVAESQNRLAQSRREQEGALLRLRAELEAAYAQAQASQKLIELYGKQIVPDAELAIESSLQGYQTGKVDFLMVLTNLVTQRDYQVSYAEEIMKFGKSLAAIDELTGNESD